MSRPISFSQQIIFNKKFETTPALLSYIQEIYKLKNTQNMEITHDKTRHMFEFTENGSSAVVEYKPFDGGINILHTFVPKPLQNKGYGAKLVKETLDYARENHLKVIITCPFARVYVARHKEYEDLL